MQIFKSGQTSAEKTASLLILLMVLLQAFYALYAYISPEAFSDLRGTELFVTADTDWVQIYASRTAFVALIVGYLLYSRNFKALAIASLAGTVMPITDAYLAYRAAAEDIVVFKHIATVIYLLIAYYILTCAVNNSAADSE
jgi:hypothetical protein